MNILAIKPTIEIFIDENDNIYQALLEYNIKIDQYTEQLKMIGAKVFNNKIGFVKLVSASEYIDLIVCPKIIGKNKEKFIKFFNIFINLKQKYPSLLNQFNIKSTYFEYELIKNLSSIKEPKDLLDNNIDFIIIYILKYFKNSAFYLKEITKFKDITLQGELDILSCIIDPIPTTIHQTNTIERLDNLQAKITLNAIHLLYHKHWNLLDAKTLNSLKSLMKFLSHKFHLRAEKVTIDFFLTHDFSSLFRGKKATLLYGYLKILLGINQGDDYKKKHMHLVIDSISITEIFFEANLFYEVIAYDYLINNKLVDELLFKKQYHYHYIDSYNQVLARLCANPDYVIFSQNNIIVADAKWKILKRLDAQFNIDFLKLHRDSQLVGANIGWLIYPRIENSLQQRHPIKLENIKDFEVYLIEIPIVLE